MKHIPTISRDHINCLGVEGLERLIVTRRRRTHPQPDTRTRIIFDPTATLAAISRRTGRDMLLWPGICIVHQAFSETELLKLKAQHPGAPVAAHPECPPHIVDHADLVGSTKAILDFALSSPAQTIIVATEPHIIHQMEKAAPHKTFIGGRAATAIATATCVRTWR